MVKNAWKNPCPENLSVFCSGQKEQEEISLIMYVLKFLYSDQIVSQILGKTCRNLHNNYCYKKSNLEAPQSLNEITIQKSFSKIEFLLALTLSRWCDFVSNDFGTIFPA